MIFLDGKSMKMSIVVNNFLGQELISPLPKIFTLLSYLILTGSS